MRFIFLCLVFMQCLSAKVYDCFTFFNELELLKIRFDEMNDYVDYFVLVEARDTFTGQDKPLYFSNNKHLFQKYMHKIIHVIVEKTPYFSDYFDREHYQRNQILRGLANCEKEDVIIISDVDEIIRRSCINPMISRLQTKDRPVIGCGCDFYRWYLNRQDTAIPWTGSRLSKFKEEHHISWVGSAITKYKFLKRKSPQKIRDLREKYHIYPKGGWHFSNMGGKEMFFAKIKAFSHKNECSHLLEIDEDEMYHRFCIPHKLVEIDDTFPKYVVENYDQLAKKKFIDLGYYR